MDSHNYFFHNFIVKNYVKGLKFNFRYVGYRSNEKVQTVVGCSNRTRVRFPLGAYFILSEWLALSHPVFPLEVTVPSIRPLEKKKNHQTKEES
jgi:hypothetical protein